MNGNIFKVENIKGVAIVTVALDVIMGDELEELKQVVTELLAGPTKNIILDFSKTGYISSLVLASLVFMHKNAKDTGGSLVMCCINKKIKEILEITNLDKIFDLAVDKDEAMARLAAR